MPASTFNVWPVIQRASSEARNDTTSAICSGWPFPFIACSISTEDERLVVPARLDAIAHPAGLARCTHLVRSCAADDKGAGQIDVDDLAPMVEIDIVPGDERHDAGIVDQNIDAPGQRLDLGEECLDRCRIGNVGGDRLRFSADRPGRGFGAFRVDVADDDGRAIDGQPSGDLLADALCGPGNQGRLSRQPFSYENAPSIVIW